MDFIVNFITKKGGVEPVQASLSSSYNTAMQSTHYSASAFGDFGSFGDFDYRLSWSDSDHNNRETPEGLILQGKSLQAKFSVQF